MRSIVCAAFCVAAISAHAEKTTYPSQGEKRALCEAKYKRLGGILKREAMNSCMKHGRVVQRKSGPTVVLGPIH